MVKTKYVICALLLSLIPAIAGAGILDKVKLPDVKIPDVKIPGLDALTGGDDPVISTSISDAQTEIPYLDDYTPKQPFPLDIFRPTKEGIFKLFPGAFEFDAQSYCLHAGTYRPGKGDGYIYAPLKGSKSGIIDSILKQSVNHPEIPQEGVQTLIWAVLARTKISEMPSEAQQAASKLLTKAEIKSLQGSALNVIPGEQMSMILNKVAEPVQRVLMAENGLRSKLTDAASSYDELAEIAVLEGDHEKGKGSREVPEGRWSYNPQGYFIRFIPDGYTKTHIELYVPERFIIMRDDSGRITSIADGNGSAIELAYNDDIQPLTFEGDPQTKAFAFKSIRFIENLPGDTTEHKWTDTGWTLAGIPNGKGQADSSAVRFNGSGKRYSNAVKLAKDFDDATSRILKSCGIKTTTLSQGSLRDLVDLSHLHTAVRQVIGGKGLKDPWTANHLDKITNAWQSSLKQRVSSVQVAALPTAFIGLIAAPGIGGTEGPGGAGGPGSGVGFSPGGGVAAPGNTCKQRIALSGRPQDNCGNSGGDGTGGALQRALKNHGIDAGDENLDIKESGSGECKLIRFHVPLGEGNKPLPKLGCAQKAIAGGNVPEGSMEGPKKILFGSVQQCGDETMVNVRTTDAETGEVTSGGRGRSKGADDSAAESAANDALGGLGL